VLLLTLARRREEHPRESHFLDAPDEHAVGSEMREHLVPTISGARVGQTWEDSVSRTDDSGY
jgi:hypothetical protein